MLHNTKVLARAKNILMIKDDHQNLGDGAWSALKKTWERDLISTLYDEEWDRISMNIKTISRDVRVLLIQLEIMHHFYRKPSRLFRLGLKDTTNCWKCKTEDGQLLHVLWSCDKVKEFWTGIHYNLCQIAVQFSSILFI